MTNPSVSSDDTQVTKQVQDTVEDFLQRVTQAWNAGDAVAYAREFTDDATYVIFRGDALRGRAEIESAHVDVFGTWQRGTRLIVDPLAITMLGDDVACVLMIGGIGVSDPIGFDKFQTATLVRRDGRWQCAAFQNTAMSDRSQHTYKGA